MGLYDLFIGVRKNKETERPGGLLSKNIQSGTKNREGNEKEKSLATTAMSNKRVNFPMILIFPIHPLFKHGE